MISDSFLQAVFCFLQQGEGVPSSRKGVCARHVRDVENFFKVSGSADSAANLMGFWDLMSCSFTLVPATSQLHPLSSP